MKGPLAAYPLWPPALRPGGSRPRLARLTLILACLAALALAPGALASPPPQQAGPAATGGGYDLAWWSADAGGGLSSGGAYTLLGSLGQPDATSASALSGGAYALAGGVLAAEGDGPRLFLPLVRR
jgi:hypothetical protein